jgi:hypothetical protein
MVASRECKAGTYTVKLAIGVARLAEAAREKKILKMHKRSHQLIENKASRPKSEPKANPIRTHFEPRADPLRSQANPPRRFKIADFRLKIGRPAS